MPFWLGIAAMADLEFLGSQQQPAAAGNGMLEGIEEDPAAAFLAQQENEIAGIENDEGYNILENGEVPAELQIPEGLDPGTLGYWEGSGPGPGTTAPQCLCSRGGAVAGGALAPSRRLPAGGECSWIGLGRAEMYCAPDRSSPSVRGWGGHGF